MTRAYLLTLLLLLPSAASATPCGDELKAAKLLATGADAEKAAAIAADEPGAELRSARAWHSAQARMGTATDALSGIDRSACSAAQSAEIAKLRSRLSTDWHDADAKFQERREAACTKLVTDSREEAKEMAKLKAVADPQIYAETGMGYEYKMIWRVSLAKAFSCTETRELFDAGRAMSGEIRAFLGTPKSDGCVNSRKLALAHSMNEDPLGFITYAHIALHYAGCDAQALIASDPAFLELFEKYHELAPQIYGSVYD